MAQAINLQITPSNVMPKIYASQFDIGREIEISLYDGASAYTPPVGTDIRFEGKKPDGNGFSYACTYTGNVVTVVTTDQMTVLAGEIPCELRMSLNGNDIGTLNIIFVIEKSPIDENVPISDTEIPAIVERARAEQYNAEAWATGERNGVPVGPEDPQYHNNAKYWAEHAEHGALDDLTDVEITTPSDGQALIYDANTDEWVNGDVVDALDDLSDTNITTPTDGQALIYDADNDEWINGDVSTVENLSELEDTDITSPADGDTLVFNGEKWENSRDLAYVRDGWQKNGAYNLCSNEKLTTQVLNGITITFNPTGYPKGCVKLDTGSGTATTGTWISINYKTMKLVTGQTYRMVGVKNGAVSTYRLHYSDGVTTEAIYDGGVNFVCGDESNTQVNIYVSSGASLSNVIVKPMITTDLNATYDDYQPYAKTNRELTEDGTPQKITLTAGTNITLTTYDYYRIGKMYYLSFNISATANIAAESVLLTGTVLGSNASHVFFKNSMTGGQALDLSNTGVVNKQAISSGESIRATVMYWSV